MSIDIEKAIKKLKKFYLKQKRSPSYQEIALMFGYASKNAAYKLIEKLIEANLIEKDSDGKIILKDLFSIPHLGRIQAGYPTMNDAIHGERLNLYELLLNMPEQIFSLTVKGDSMIDAGINEGDIVLIDKDRRFEVGDIVAALVDNEWTIKYIERKDDEFCLVPANPEYPVIYPKENLAIGGIVISVIRKYH